MAPSRPKTIVKIETSSKDQYHMYLAARCSIVIDQIINSPKFEDMILRMKFHPSWTLNLSNPQIYNKIMLGAERHPVASPSDREWDIRLEFYRSAWIKRKVIGWTNPGIATMYTNTRHITGRIDRDTIHLCGNIAHEYMHKLGFDHSFRRSNVWPQTVPYAVGNIISYLSEQYA